MIDDEKRKRSGGDRGPRYQPLPAEELRRHTVSVRLNDAELAELDARRQLVNMQRGEYLRTVAFGQLPPTIPAVNRDAYIELTRIGVNVHQLAKRGNFGEVLQLDEVRKQIDDLRTALINLGAGSEEGGR